MLVNETINCGIYVEQNQNEIRIQEELRKIKTGNENISEESKLKRKN